MPTMRVLVAIVFLAGFLFSLSNCSPGTGLSCASDTKHNYLAIAEKDGKWGYIDPDNKWVIENQYDQAESFNYGLALVRKGDRWGYITTSGTVKIPLKFQEATSFANGYAAVKQDDKWGIIDKNGNFTTPHRFDAIDILSEGYRAVRIDDNWGYADEKGNIVIEPKFVSASAFSDKMGTVVMKDGTPAAIDGSGSVVIQDSLYSTISPFYAGHALVTSKANGKMGVIDAKGKILVPPTYLRLSFNANPRFIDIATQLHGPARGLISNTGKIVLDTVYDRIDLVKEGLVAVCRNGKCGYADTSGRLIIPLQYESAGAFSGGVAPVKMNGKYGFINTRGEQVAEPRYDEVFPFDRGYACVKIKDRSGVIDTSGNVVIPIEHDFVSYHHNNGFFLFKKDGKYGMINKCGNEVIPPVYTMLHRAFLVLDKDGNMLDQ